MVLQPGKVFRRAAVRAGCATDAWGQRHLQKSRIPQQSARCEPARRIRCRRCLFDLRARQLSGSHSIRSHQRRNVNSWTSGAPTNVVTLWI